MDKSQVGRWVSQLKDQLSTVEHSKSRRLGKAGRKELFPEEEARLYAWIIQMRNAALAVTYDSLTFEMLKFVSETTTNTNDSIKKEVTHNFKASKTWLAHFLKRYKLTLH